MIFMFLKVKHHCLLTILLKKGEKKLFKSFRPYFVLYFRKVATDFPPIEQIMVKRSPVGSLETLSWMQFCSRCVTLPFSTATKHNLRAPLVCFQNGCVMSLISGRLPLCVAPSSLSCSYLLWAGHTSHLLSSKPPTIQDKRPSAPLIDVRKTSVPP